MKSEFLKILLFTFFTITLNSCKSTKSISSTTQINPWGLYPYADYVGCGPGVTTLLGRYQTKKKCSKAGRARYRNVPRASWCCKKIR